MKSSNSSGVQHLPFNNSSAKLQRYVRVRMCVCVCVRVGFCPPYLLPCLAVVHALLIVLCVPTGWRGCGLQEALECIDEHTAEVKSMNQQLRKQLIKVFQQSKVCCQQRERERECVCVCVCVCV